MKDEIQLWNYEGSKVRTITIDNEPWFVGKDIAEALGYADTVNAIKRHVDGDDKRGWQIATPSGAQNTIVINESGMYSLILSSKLPTAKRFKRWVTSEVLPAIRRTGAYATRYTPKASSIREVVNLIRITRETMEAQGCSASDIAKAVKEICDQFNVRLPDCFIKPKSTTMTDVYDMIDFIYSWKGKRKPTYDDFVVHQATLKLETR